MCVTSAGADDSQTGFIVEDFLLYGALGGANLNFFMRLHCVINILFTFSKILNLKYKNTQLHLNILNQKSYVASLYLNDISVNNMFII